MDKNYFSKTLIKRLFKFKRLFNLRFKQWDMGKTEKEIMDKAIELFAQKGFEEVLSATWPQPGWTLPWIIILLERQTFWSHRGIQSQFYARQLDEIAATTMSDRK